MIKPAVSQEKSLSKVGAIFKSPAQLEAARSELVAETGIEAQQVALVTPADSDNLSLKLEPERQGIKRTLVSSHLTFGLVGIGVGVVIALLLILAGPVATQQSPIYAAGIILGYCTAFGLMIGGLVALRPDHDRILLAARDALRSGQGMLVVHARSSSEQEQAKAWLEQHASRVVKTL